MPTAVFFYMIYMIIAVGLGSLQGILWDRNVNKYFM